MEEYNQSFKKEVGGGGLISLKKKSQVLHSLFLTFIFYSLVCSRESLLHTVTIACLRLAAKVSEEEEVGTPGVHSGLLLEVLGCNTGHSSFLCTWEWWAFCFYFKYILLITEREMSVMRENY